MQPEPTKRILSLLFIFAATLLLAAHPANAADLYERKANWQETMLTAREHCLKAGLKCADEASSRPLVQLWAGVERDFPLMAIRAEKHLPHGGYFDWLTAAKPAALENLMLRAALKELDTSGAKLASEYEGLLKTKPRPASTRFLNLYVRVCTAHKLSADLAGKVNFRALALAIEDLTKSYPTQYTRGAEFLKQAGQLEKRLPQVQALLARCDDPSFQATRQYIDEFIALQRQALLANPLLNFDQLLLIKRKPLGNSYRSEDPDKGTGKYIGMPQQSSWQLQTMTQSYVTSWENEIDTLAMRQPDGPLETVFHSTGQRLLSDMDLHFDGDRILFSMPDERLLWQLYELNVKDRKLRQVSRGDQPDVHSIDGCYLPNGQIAFISTAVFQGVPCNAGVNVGNLYSMDADGGNVRQLCFDQDHNFCPVVMNDGRILYMRWEYADIPHVWARFLFTMNPDGTSQREYFGTGSYWPNSIFYARPIPNSPTKVVGIAVGHHVGRQGELFIFDPSKSHDKTRGTVQQIPGYGKKVEPVIMDKLTEKTWPKFLHPFPLSDKYFLAACRPSPEDLWGIYLVDIYDNMVPVRVIDGYALLEPIPLRKTVKPPVIGPRVDLARKDSLIYIEDIYKGTSLTGVPRDTIKSLRLLTYHFAYRTVAGITHRVGADGPWEPKVILGTVPIEPDGSAFFRAPANTPLTIQALDGEGRAVQLMRSWMTAMPGEVLSCVGCHEKVNYAPPNFTSGSIARKPREITPWRGPARGLSFIRDVQPVLDRYCVSCHNGAPNPQGAPLADLRRDQGVYLAYQSSNPQPDLIRGPLTDDLFKKYGGIFEPSYIALRRYVRPAGIESDLRPINPMEFDARTTELIQMLEKGHHGVKLDDEAWDRLVTWIDLNAPCHGTWQEVVGVHKIENDHRRRVAMKKLYNGLYDDPEMVPEKPDQAIAAVTPDPEPKIAEKAVNCPGWPFNAAEAARRQGPAETARRSLDLGGGIKLDLALIPAGGFVMGDLQGAADERPLTPVEIKKPFWMGTLEITNEQYRRFDPAHESRYEHKGTWKFDEVDLGWPQDGPTQPAVRVSWQEALAFCQWLSAKSGLIVTLPTEVQWEYACRAGAATPFSFGDLNTDFSPYANMADAQLKALAWSLRSPRPPDLQPREDRFDDGQIVTCAAGHYRPNPWGLFDMHGNAWEWTRSTYEPYPGQSGEDREDVNGGGLKVVRGGSWFDRPKRCTAAFRLSYQPWQKVYNVGFRVIAEENAPSLSTSK